MNLRFEAAAKSEGGRRPANEDFYLIDDELKLYLVADGTASRGGGRTAAMIACNTVRDLLTSRAQELAGEDPAAVPTVIQQAIMSANDQIKAKQATDPNLNRMATTLVLAMQRGTDLHMAYVGDSRIYLCRSGELTQLTRDHSLENFLKDNPQVKPSVQRPGKTLLSALGLDKSQIRIDYLHQTLERDDLVILCSDGLTEGLPDWILREILAGAYIGTIEQTVGSLVSAALSHGSMDNTTVILLHATERTPIGDGQTVIFEADAMPGALAPAKRFLGWLAFTEGPQRGSLIPLDSRMTIGASSSCSVVLKGDNFVSSNHAEVLLTESGFQVKDLRSTNGTFLNNVRIKEEMLLDGDILRVGKTPMLFKGYKL